MLRPALWPLALIGCVPPAPPSDPPDTDPVDTDPPPAFADLPTGAWSYVGVPGMVCGDGSPTGIGVHPGSSDEVLLLVQGGGACWDALTCFVLNSAVNVTSGWGEAKLRAETDALASFPLLDRARADNPFRDATWVWVPYCTGDLHIGRTVKTYVDWQPDQRLHHAGDANMAAVLDLVHGQIAAPSRVWAMGFSAGGYGVQLQADRIRAAWPDADLALLADGAPMVRPYGGRWGEFRTAWDPRFPEGCTDCDQGFPQIFAHQIANAPAGHGLLTFRNDAVITLYLNYPAGGLPGATDALLDGPYAATGVEAFVLDGDDHVMIGGLDTRVARDGTTLRAWVEAWASGEGFATAR